MSNTYVPERAMFIFAHPDDIEFSVAGTAAKWAKYGCENTYVVITDGNAGSHEPGMTRGEIGHIRREEQTAAAKVAGATHCIFLGYDDGSLEPSLELRKDLVKLIRQHKPNAVVCGDPNLFFRGERLNHPDHRAAARAALDSVFPTCEMRLLYPEFEAEGIEPHKVNFVYVSTDQELNHYEDVSESLDTKLLALKEHKSQVGDNDYSDRLRERAANVGKQVGLAYAEAFRRFTVTPLPTPQEGGAVMKNANEYIPARAMFIFAHPDDIEFGSAGTAAKWSRHGSEVTYVVLTDGNIGSREEGMTAEKLAEIRRREQSEAAEVAGVARCLFMGEPDGRLQPTLELRKKLVRLIRQYTPNVVVCGDPQFFYSDGYINHPDHRNAGQVAMEAVFPSGDSPLLFPELVEEGYAPHKVNYVYISFGRREANMYIDITETIDTKIAALRKHVSQLGDWDPEERMREWASETGKRVGYEYAEGYFRITLQEIEEETEPEPETELEAQAEAGIDR